MDARLEVIGEDALARYASVPMTIEVRSVVDVDALEAGGGAVVLREQPVAAPYVKDYDAHGDPTTWPQQFDLSGWRLVLALEGNEVLGAAASFGSDGEGRAATLWDIRVRPEAQRAGLGRALLRDALDWARTEGHRELRAETQHVNVPACRFYHSIGATLASVDRFAYAAQADIEHEVRLDWVFAVEV